MTGWPKIHFVLLWAIAPLLFFSGCKTPASFSKTAERAAKEEAEKRYANRAMLVVSEIGVLPTEGVGIRGIQKTAVEKVDGPLINPDSIHSLIATRLNGGFLPVGSWANRRLIVTNIGRSAANSIDWSFSENSGNFSFFGGSAPGIGGTCIEPRLASGASCTFVLSLKPTQMGLVTDDLIGKYNTNGTEDANQDAEYKLTLGVEGNNLANVNLTYGSNSPGTTIDLGYILPGAQRLFDVNAVATGLRNVDSPSWSKSSALVESVNDSCPKNQMPMGSQCGHSWKVTAPLVLGPFAFKIKFLYNNGAFGKMAEISFTATVGTPPVSSAVLLGFMPTSGLVGTSVTLSGSYLANASDVRFNGLASAITSNSDSEISVTVPIGATTGKVSVTTPGGTTTSAQDFTVTVPPPLNPPPTIVSFTPTSGIEGATVTVTGTNLSAATAVAFGALTAAIVSKTATEIIVNVPVTAVTAKIGVSTPYGSALSASNFTVLPFAPTIGSFSPGSGLIGASIVIDGTNFTGATVRFNGTAATIATVSNGGTRVTATVPAGATTGTISVATAGGTATSTGSFTVNPNPAAGGISPASWNFGRTLATTTVTKVFVLSNTGGSPAENISPSVTGIGYSLSSTTCGATLNAGANCSVTVAFTPTAVQNYPGGQVSVSSSSFSTISASLNGDGGLQGNITANLSSVDFGSVSLRDIANRTVIFTNCATCIAVTLSLGSVTAPYTITSATSATLQPGASFSGVFRFTPTVFGTHTLTINPSYVPKPGDSATTIPIDFTGVGDTKGKLTASPTTLTAYPSTVAGTTSSTTRTFTLTRYGSDDVPAVITSNNANFTVGTYPSPIAANTTVVTISFSPTSAGLKSGIINVAPTFSDNTGSLNIAVSGNAVAPALLTSNPISLVLGDRTVGGSYTGTIILTNSGGVAATSFSPAFSPAVPGLSLSHACLSTIAVLGTCSLTVSYTPVEGVTTGSVVATYQNGAATTNVTTAVSGNGVLRALLALELANQSYGKVLLGEIGSKTITVRNNGSGPATNISPTIATPYAVALNDCPASLGVGATCTISTTFSPTAPPADHSQNFQLAYHDGVATQSVARSLSGRGTIPEAITVGGNHACALTELGRVKCWGSNSYAQLGTGDLIGRGGPASPALVAVNFGVGRYAVKVAAGSAHNCALLDNGGVKCWGKNDQGQLGLGRSNPIFGSSPAELGTNLPDVNLGTLLGQPLVASQVSTGFAHTCVIAATIAAPENHVLKCFGANTAGQLGLGDQLSRGASPSDMGDSLPAVALPGIPLGVAADTSHTLVLVTSGATTAAVAFGDNFYGQQGKPERVSLANSHAGDPISFGTGKEPVQVAVGGAVSIARFTDGTIKAWGLNAFPPDLMGTLGQPWCQNLNQEAVACIGPDPGNVVDGYGYQTNAMGNHLPSISLGAGFSVASVSGGGFHSCAVNEAGGVKCWGDNSYGQLGLGDPNSRGTSLAQMGDSLLPVNLGANLSALQVATGYLSTCALVKNMGTAATGFKCWGNNQLGQLGLGDLISRGGEAGQMGDNLPFVPVQP